MLGFWLIHHANMREGTTDRKPPLQHRAKWESCARARANERNGNCWLWQAKIANRLPKEETATTERLRDEELKNDRICNE
jgi:hypothetical protein